MLPVHEDAKMQPYDHKHFRNSEVASQRGLLFIIKRKIYICIEALQETTANL
jgi:hypothetical protein